MKKLPQLAIGVLVLAGFIAVFLSAGGIDLVRRPMAVTPTPLVETRGHYQQYLYGISDISGKNKKMAQFDPPLPADNPTVLAALKAVAKDGYGITIAEAEQPVVEAVDEFNYVTYPAGGSRLYFELFANSSGRVGSVRFWRQ